MVIKLPEFDGDLHKLANELCRQMDVLRDQDFQTHSIEVTFEVTLFGAAGKNAGIASVSVPKKRITSFE